MRRLSLSETAWPIGVVAILVVLPGCAGKRVGPVTGRELVEVDEAWAKAADAGDLDAIMAYWTEDAVLYPEGHVPVYGKKGIRAFLEDRRSRPGYRISWTPSCAGVDPAGSMAYTLGEGRATVVDKAGDTGELSGRYVAIWRRDDGRWRCAVKCWNTSPPELAANRPPKP